MSEDCKLHKHSPDEPVPCMLLPVERKRLRDQGRDAFYKQHGRDVSVGRAAVEALGANARRRDLDSWKRNLCGRRFMALTRARQLELLPAFESYHADEDAREAAETEASSAFHAAAASSCRGESGTSRTRLRVRGGSCALEIRRSWTEAQTRTSQGTEAAQLEGHEGQDPQGHSETHAASDE